MRKISLWLLILTFAVCAAHGQDAATQQQIDKLAGQIQDLQEATAAQTKRLSALEREIGELREKLNQAPADAGASADDLKKLAVQVQEIDKKRQADNDKILKTLEKLGKVSGGSDTGRRPSTSASTSSDTATRGAGGAQKGYDYTIAAGDTLSTVARAYRSHGVKVTSEQILAANPGLDPKKLSVGQKIFIPDPNAK